MAGWGIKTQVKKKVYFVLGSTGLAERLTPRRIHAYCCGTGRAGGHSMRNTFRNYRCAYEPDSRNALDLATRLIDGEIAETELRARLVRRDWALHLEAESSNLAALFAPQLIDLFPRAKFILNIRDCFSWVDSMFNNALNRPYSSGWAGVMRRRLRPEVHTHSRHDAPLAERGLYSLASYFSYWAAHNQSVLDQVPEDRLLVVRTNEIASCTGDMARFLGIAEDALLPEAGRKFATRAEHKHGMLARLDPAYVRETAERCCGDLLRKFYPELAHWEPAPRQEAAVAG